MTSPSLKHYHYTPLRNSNRAQVSGEHTLDSLEPSRIKAFKVVVRPKLIYTVELFYYTDFVFVKFHPNLFETYPDKYKRVGLGLTPGEIKTFLNTCCKIVVKDFKKNSESFVYAFIGQWYDRDNELQRLLTKRFSLYEKQVTTYFSEENFTHVAYEIINFYCISAKSNTALPDQLEKFLNTLAKTDSIVQDFMTERAKAEIYQ